MDVEWNATIYAGTKETKLYVSWELKCGVEWNSVRNEREVGVQ